MRQATNTALVSVSSGVMWNIHTSLGSAMVSASPRSPSSMSAP